MDQTLERLLTKKNVELLLRVAVFGEFLGHGLIAVSGKAQWVGWVVKLTHLDPLTATKLLLVIGTLDIFVSLIVLFKPVKPVLLWAVFWGFATALIRPIVGEPFLDFVERWANWGAPLALLYLINTQK